MHVPMHFDPRSEQAAGPTCWGHRAAVDIPQANIAGLVPAGHQQAVTAGVPCEVDCTVLGDLRSAQSLSTG